MYILRHRKLPCTFIWRDPIGLWEKRMKKYLQEEIKHNGFENFVLEEKKEEPEEKK